uniref:Uncharacterized protein LOC100186076 n=1 Tax=Phallusia mammillata TaxID=59560 RepID=A0A6F9DJ12_9ASCI|nr:uncharacterized protein LOC100186076 [Phallusia mammillata]
MNKVQIVLVFAAFFIYIIALVISYLSSARIPGLFYNTLSNLNNKYAQQVSPKSIAFGIIWPIIYFWNLVGIIYIVVSCFLPVAKSPVKMAPSLVPKTFLISYCAAFIVTVGWLFAFDREVMGLSFALLLVAALSVYVSVGALCKAAADNAEALEKDNKVVFWLMRILVQNGLSLLGTWLTVATLVNLAVVIIYEDSFGLEAAVQRGTISIVNGSTVSLVILLVIVITWFVLENFVLEKYCRYLYTIYPVFILATSALIDKLRALPNGKQNLIIASVDLAVVLVAFIVRVILAVYRRNQRLLV